MQNMQELAAATDTDSNSKIAAKSRILDHCGQTDLNLLPTVVVEPKKHEKIVKYKLKISFRAGVVLYYSMCCCIITFKGDQ